MLRASPLQIDQTQCAVHLLLLQEPCQIEHPGPRRARKPPAYQGFLITMPMLDNEPPYNQYQMEFDLPDDAGASMLNPRFRFDNFMVGRSNRLACAGATSVGENPARSYNPLCIY